MSEKPDAGSQDHHMTIKERKESSDVDIEDMIEKSGCSQEYYMLEECLGEHDRDWRKCQKTVKDLRLCNERPKKK